MVFCKMDRRTLPSSGLKTRYSSGFTAPCTTSSPRPHAALMRTTRGKPLSVSSEHMTPALAHLRLLAVVVVELLRLPRDTVLGETPGRGAASHRDIGRPHAAACREVAMRGANRLLDLPGKPPRRGCARCRGAKQRHSRGS